MATSFTSTSSAASEIYERGLSSKSDVYLVASGPEETRGWGSHIPLFFVETPVGEAPSQDEIDIHAQEYGFAEFDAQAPRLLTYEDLATRSLHHQAAVDHDAREMTSEFEALIAGVQFDPSIQTEFAQVDMANMEASFLSSSRSVQGFGAVEENRQQASLPRWNGSNNSTGA
ncbi:MAG: hypothetical protein AAB462_03065 [Patescibacteria group bacterium]